MNNQLSCEAFINMCEELMIPAEEGFKDVGNKIVEKVKQFCITVRHVFQRFLIRIKGVTKLNKWLPKEIDLACQHVADKAMMAQIFIEHHKNLDDLNEDLKRIDEIEKSKEYQLLKNTTKITREDYVKGLAHNSIWISYYKGLVIDSDKHLEKLEKLLVSMGQNEDKHFSMIFNLAQRVFSIVLTVLRVVLLAIKVPEEVKLLYEE